MQAFVHNPYETFVQCACPACIPPPSYCPCPYCAPSQVLPYPELAEAIRAAPSCQAFAKFLEEKLANTRARSEKLPETSKNEKDKVAVDPRKYKTKMCRNWVETGSCPYEHTCCFAHGQEELRDLPSNHKVLASIGYFSNLILLAMTNSPKPAIPLHTLYQQPALFPAPETHEELEAAASMLPPGTNFPFQKPLKDALMVRARSASPSSSSNSSGPIQPEDAPSASGKRRRRARRRNKDQPDVQS
eukprot:TRINITY_DN13747_c0_g2_i1.p1 TRINITY_DN13747_c0_g2~~TRINITY_DN13747_c0_g2_i1.p1  ORF type:complete len:245 (+),score=14.79 TRINITY_DN13747_c0_g2_i1:116-850(+)